MSHTEIPPSGEAPPSKLMKAEQLNQLPGLGSNYRYRKLLDSEIRVLALLPGTDEAPVQCRLDHVSLAAQPKYETISYAWGNPNELSTIECEGETITVTQNLQSALKNLRYGDAERILWADAICINQQDLEERSNQVLMMGEIYAQAQRVAVWLGEETEDTKDSIEEIKKLHTFFLENEEGYPNDPKRWHFYPEGVSPISKALMDLQDQWMLPMANMLKRPWFLRRWVIQEVAKSPDAIVVVGKKHLSWVIVADVIWSIHNAGLMLQFGGGDGTSLLAAPGAQSVILIELVRRDVINTGGSRLLELIISVRQYHCLDPRDVIYSVLGVACDVDTLSAAPLTGDQDLSSTSPLISRAQPDYTLSVEEVYLNFVLAHIKNKKSLLPLNANYIEPPNPVLNLPSWVPDFSNLSLANPLMYLRNEPALPFTASKGSTLKVRFSNNHRTMHVTGRVIDTISAISARQEDVVLTPELEEQALAENWDADKILTTKAIKWLADAILLFDPTPNAPGTIYGLSPARFNDFACTLACNLSGSGDTPPANFSQFVLQYMDALCEGLETAARKHIVGDDQQTFISNIMVAEAAMSLRALGWCFAATEKGGMGRVLTSAKAGDKVVLLGGGETPYVLRKHPEGGWVFRGSCYIHGMMYGDGMLLEGIEDEEFDIH